MNITQTNPRILPSWWMTLVATICVFLALPFLMMRLQLLRGEEALAVMQKGEATNLEQGRLIEISRINVDSWFNSAFVNGDLALLYLTQGELAQSDQEKVTFFAEAQKRQIEALRKGPADCYGWFRLAYLLYRQNGASAAVAEAWLRALQSAPYEPRLAPAELRLAFLLEDYMGPDARHYVPGLFYAMQNTDPELLARMALQDSFVSVVDKAFAEDSTAQADFRRNVTKVFSELARAR